MNVCVHDWNLGVRVDSPTRARVISQLFRQYVSSEPMTLRSNFSIRQRTRRIRPNDFELYIGGALAARALRFRSILYSLCGHLAGLEQPDDAYLTADLRAFAAGPNVVLVDLARPRLVDDKRLSRAGITELPIWAPAIDVAAGSIRIPDPLAMLDWKSVRLRPPVLGNKVLKICGLVTTTQIGLDAPAQTDLRPDSSDADAFAELIDHFMRQGTCTQIETPDEAVRLLISHLGKPAGQKQHVSD